MQDPESKSKTCVQLAFHFITHLRGLALIELRLARKLTHVFPLSNEMREIYATRVSLRADL